MHVMQKSFSKDLDCHSNSLFVKMNGPNYRVLGGGKIAGRQIRGKEVETESDQTCEHWKNTL